MKYIKKYENIDSNQYLVIKHQNFLKYNNNIGLMKTRNKTYHLYNKILVQIIEPKESTTYTIDLTEIYENTYEDEFNFTFEVLYKSKNYNDAKKMFDIYSNINKYNL